MLLLLQRWDAMRARPGYRAAGVVFGLALAAAVLAAPAPEGLSPEGQRAGAVTALMAAWWLGGVLPMAATALVPLLAFPLLGVASSRDAAAPYADPLNFLMLGGFVLAHAMEDVGLHRRLVAALLGPTWVRSGPRRVALALMVATACVSGFVSNTATMVMMLPIALGLAASCAEDRRTRAAFTLSTAYACSIGGVATLVGTAPNAVFAGLAASMAGREVGFLDWMSVGVPFVALSLPVAWLVVNFVALPLPARAAREAVAPTVGFWTRDERIVLGVIGACFAAWLTRNPVDLGVLRIPGWGALLPVKVDDGFVAIAGALALFLFPRARSSDGGSGHDDDGDEGRFLLSWRRTSRAVPWSVLILLGGGFSLAEAIQSSGLSAWLAGGAAGLAMLGSVASTLVICVGIAFMSAFTSNTATTQIALPLLAAGATAAGVDPILWMAPAAISASCDFTMAVGTPPNAIAAEAGDVSPSDMAFAGVILNVACALIATAVALVLVPAML